VILARLGSVLLLIALVVAGYGAVVAARAGRGARTASFERARQVSHLVLALVVAVNVVMLLALLRDDFAVRYVAENSSRETPTFYKVLSLWAADDGSLLLWNLVLSGYVAAVAWRFRRNRPVIAPYAMSVLFAVQVFYLVLVNGPARPFGLLARAPLDGRGPAPLLQNHPLMAVHPPFLYLGFIGFTVPFAFGIAALLVGRGSDDWAGLTRRWTLAVWCFLTVGLALGALWSYSVLGWGGYWAWDPVENVALLPWLVATGFLHSVMLQERRGMARLWNIVLVIAAFALTTFGTFLTRGNVLTSIHAFTESAVGPVYLTFLALVLLGGFGLVAWRSATLRTPAQLDSVVSREAAFVGNNVLLLAATGIILLGTVFPMFVEAVTGNQVTVGAPYFRKAVAPVFLLLLLLVGTAPLLPWRSGDKARAVRRLRVPVAAGTTVVVVLALAGVTQVEAVAGLGLATLVAVTNGQEIARGLAAGARGGRSGVLATFLRGRRRYCALTVHVGLAVVAAGITVSSSFGQQVEVTLHSGSSTVFAGQRLTYGTLRTSNQPQRVVLTAPVRVTSLSGAPQGVLAPRMNLYPAAAEPIGSPSIHRGFVWDTYASLLSLQQDGRSATFRFYRNPGVNWLWVGALVMALGGAGAGWPERRPTARPSGVPAARRARALTGAR
jgi:cytochrome c-type biogenesis protein CcmF